MIWALLYPVRHTADPPRLSPTSPFRVIFQRHAESVSKHPLFYIIHCVILGIALCYPFPHLYYAASPPPPSMGPHHVWSSARPFSSTRSPPDFGLKHAWIHGSYMGALNATVLLEALDIQEDLLGPSSLYARIHSRELAATEIMPPILHGTNPTRKSFFHSPLLYWNHSRTAIKNDPDIINTVNMYADWLSASNLTLRWGSVFAGKSFSHSRLVAADALVITLFYRLDSDEGYKWNERAAALTAKHSDRWDIYPSDGQSRLATPYEFRVQSMSTGDTVALAFCYSLTGIFIVGSLRGIKAVKSRLGLAIAVIIQICASVMSSFTVLAILQVPVSHIPREVFPFVVMIIGLENMFRLVKAVFNTPAEQSPIIRMSMGLGEVGFVSTVAVLTDLAMLGVIGHFSVPAVREFCTFAGVALAMDFAFHMTYFVAVLSIDVRRLELQDSLNRSAERQPSSEKKPWHKSASNKLLKFLFWGDAPTSSRVAGSAILICFVAALDWHFFDSGNPLRIAGALLDILAGKRQSRSLQSTAAPINQARSPGAWLRLQDQLTGMELIRAIKGEGIRVIAKVHDPILFVIKGSDRTSITNRLSRVMGRIDFSALREHSQPFLLLLIGVCALTTLFLNNLLADDSRESLEQPLEEKPFFTSRRLQGGHVLDIVRMCASSRGLLVSVGLDKRISMWQLKPLSQHIFLPCIIATPSQPKIWPVVSVAIDDQGEMVAIASRDGVVAIWSTRERTYVTFTNVDLRGSMPVLFYATCKDHAPASEALLIVVRNDGWLYEVVMSTGDVTQHLLLQQAGIICSQWIQPARSAARIVSACQQNTVLVSSRADAGWTSQQLIFPRSFVTYGLGKSNDNLEVLAVQSLGIFIFASGCSVHLVDLASGVILRTLQIGQYTPKSLRLLYFRKRTCPQCSRFMVRSFSLSYTEADTSTLILHTFTANTSVRPDICFRQAVAGLSCRTLDQLEETLHWVENPGCWEASGINIIVGARKMKCANQEVMRNENSHGLSVALPSVRRRKKLDVLVSEQLEFWEIWTLSADGNFESEMVRDQEAIGDNSDLFVPRAGPACRIGQRSIAVAFGNGVRIVLLGNERFGDASEDDDLVLVAGALKRKHLMRKETF